MIGATDRAIDQFRLANKDFSEAGFAKQLRIYPDAGHRFPLDREQELTRALNFACAP